MLWAALQTSVSSPCAFEALTCVLFSNEIKNSLKNNQGLGNNNQVIPATKIGYLPQISKLSSNQVYAKKVQANQNVLNSTLCF